MYRMLKAEYRYNGAFNAVMFILIPVPTYFLTIAGLTDTYMVFIVPGYFISLISIAFAVKERRERLSVLLPVKRLSISAARVLLIVLPFIAAWTLFAVSLAVFSDISHAFSLPILAFMGLYLLGLAVYLVIRDFVKTFQAVSVSRAKLIKNSAMLVLFSLTLLAFISGLQVSGGGEIPLYIRIVGGIFGVLFSREGTAGLYAFTAAFYVLSILTFARRQSYM